MIVLATVYAAIAIVCYPRIIAINTWRMQRRHYPSQDKPDGSDWFFFGVIQGAAIACLWPALVIKRLGKMIGLNHTIGRLLLWYVGPPPEVLRERRQERIKEIEKDIW